MISNPASYGIAIFCAIWGIAVTLEAVIWPLVRGIRARTRWSRRCGP